MIGALVLFATTLAFALAPFFITDFNGFAPDLFPIPQVDPPAQPAGWAFAIWGLIYLWLLASATFGLMFRRDAQAWRSMRGPLILATTFGAAWLAVAQNQPLIAALMMVVMLVMSVQALFKSPRTDRLMASWPIGLFAGWLSAATCVAAALCLAGYGLMTEAEAAQATTGIAIVLSAGVQVVLHRTPTFGLAVIWALAGIFAANTGTETEVAALAMGGIIVMVPLTAFAVIWDLRGPKRRGPNGERIA